MKHTALLALEDGSLFYGEAIGVHGQVAGEVVFNTAITGYQEILTDPSYCRQIVTLTHPHIGNVGCNAEDAESQRVFASGLVIRDLSMLATNWRSRWDLPAYLKHHQVVAIAGIDTRRLTRIVRQQGSLRAAIVADLPDRLDTGSAVEMARAFPGMLGMDLAKEVSTKTRHSWRESVWSLPAAKAVHTPDTKFNVVAYDFGVKQNILRTLVASGCDVTVVPAETPAVEVLAGSPDGVFLSNGPGDPEPCEYAIVAIRELAAQYVPIFGICLGYQLLALAMGAKTVKMKFGHHGANHPVQCLATGQVMITSQNHSFAVDEASLPKTVHATHRSLFDGSLQGIAHAKLPAFGFQGHPEASPGPHDARDLFARFTALMEAN